MGKIVAIGGGDLAALQTLAIDQEVIRLTGKARPRALFIPTASSDSRERWDIFRTAYGEKLGCRTDVLYLLGVNPPWAELEKKVLGADLIYVGGGNTLKMMRRWRRLGVDKLLQTAYATGIVLAGVSAGAICWFTYGHSDSMSFYHPESWRYIRVKGLGFIDATACPHYNGETSGIKREDDFQQMLMKYPDHGIALDDCCALEVIDGAYRVVTSQDGVNAYHLYKKNGRLTVQRLEQKPQLTPLANLWQG